MSPKRVVNMDGYSLRGAFVDADQVALAAAASSSADADQVVPAVVVEDVATSSSIAEVNFFDRVLASQGLTGNTSANVSASADVSYLSHTVAQILDQETESDDDEPEDRVAPKAKAKAKGKAAAKVKGAAKAKVKGAAKAKAKAKAPPLPPLTGTAKNLDRINANSLRGVLHLLHVDTEGLNKRNLIETLAALLGDIPEEADEEEDADEEADDEDDEADDDE